MTTIAIDGATVAADGLRVWGGEIRGRAHKKLKVCNGTIYAFTGLAPLFDVMVAWHQNGTDPEKLPKISDDEGWTLIVIDKDGVGKFTKGCPYIEHFGPPIAFGAGQDYAIGAMLAGATAGQAIGIVAGLCNHTGGEIQVINIAEALGLQHVREAAE